MNLTKLKYWAIIWLSCLWLVGNSQLRLVSNDSISYTKLMFVGDLPINNKLVDRYYDEEADEFNFEPLFYHIQPILNLGDIVMGNLEMSLGEGPYARYPKFTAPKEFATALKFSGFNLLATANGKMAYQDEGDFLLQRESLLETGLQNIGTYLHEDERFDLHPKIIEKNGIKTAFLNYMDGIDYYPEVSPVINPVMESQIERDVTLARNRGAEFIVVYFNWGKEYQTGANVAQQRLAELCKNIGVDLVLGSHPHIVQDFQLNQYIADNKLVENRTFYSLGDFYTTTQSNEVNAGIILEIVVCKEKKTGKVSVCEAGYIPTYTYEYEQFGKTQFAILPVSSVETANITTYMPEETYESMVSSAQKVRYKMGSFIDEIKYELDDAILADVSESNRVTSRPQNEEKDFTLNPNDVGYASAGFDEVPEINISNTTDKGIQYKIQFLTLKKEVPLDTRYYMHLEGYEVVREDGFYKYLIGSHNNLKNANDQCLDVKRMGHGKAFVVAYRKGKRVNF